MEGRPAKRRSFIDVQRKSQVFDQLFDNDNENTSLKENTKITMKQYLALLKKERAEWKALVELRSKQLQEQHKTVSTKEKNVKNQNDMERFLDEEDKIFLNDEPDYQGMVECAGKYFKAVEFIKKYKLDLVEHYEQIIEETEVENDELIENLCQKDMCELCNNINCSNDGHKCYPVT